MDRCTNAAAFCRGTSRFAAALAACAALWLAGCGDGGGNPQQAAAGAPRLAATVVTDGATVSALTLVRETRLGRTLFEYEFKVTLHNGAQARSNVVAQATAAGAGTSIVDGTVQAGQIAANADVTPADTITLRHDRTYPFNPAALVWQVTADAAPPEQTVELDRGAEVAGPDANANGIRDDIDQLLPRIGPPEQQKPLQQMARAIQRSIAGTATQSDALAASTAIDQALGCLHGKSTDYADQVRFLLTATLNTEARFRANMRLQQLLQGLDRTEMAAAVCTE
jgi:hypothetical protein